MGLRGGWQQATAPTFFTDGEPDRTPPEFPPWWGPDDLAALVSEAAQQWGRLALAASAAVAEFWQGSFFEVNQPLPAVPDRDLGDRAEDAAERAWVGVASLSAREAVAGFSAYGTEPVAPLPVVPWWTDQGDVRAELTQPSYGLEQFWAWSSTEVADQDAVSEIGFIGLGDDLVRPGPVQWPDLFVGTTTEATAPPAVPDFGWVGLGDDCLRPLAADQSDVWIGKPDEVEAAPETAFLPETDDLKTEAASIARLRQAANREALEFLAWSTVTPETLPAFGWLILGDDIIRPVPRGASEIWGVFTSALEVAGAPVKGPTKAAVLTGRGFVLMRGQTRTKVRVDNPEVVVLG